jgi:hypothetical protein
MTQRRRLDALEALSQDPGATEAERRLAAERLARLCGAGPMPAPDTEIEFDDELIAAFDRAMARAANVRSSKHRAARIRAAEQRLGRQTAQQWRDGRGPALRR